MCWNRLSSWREPFQSRLNSERFRGFWHLIAGFGCCLGFWGWERNRKRFLRWSARIESDFFEIVLRKELDRDDFGGSRGIWWLWRFDYSNQVIGRIGSYFEHFSLESDHDLDGSAWCRSGYEILCVRSSRSVVFEDQSHDKWLGYLGRRSCRDFRKLESEYK